MDFGCESAKYESAKCWEIASVRTNEYIARSSAKVKIKVFDIDFDLVC